MTLYEFKKTPNANKFLKALKNCEKPFLIKILEDAIETTVIINFVEKTLEILTNDNKRFFFQIDSEGYIKQRNSYSKYLKFDKKRKDFYHKLIKEKYNISLIDFYEKFIDYIEELEDYEIDIILEVHNDIIENDFMFNYNFEYRWLTIEIILIEETPFYNKTYFTIPFNLGYIVQAKFIYDLFKDRFKNFSVIKKLKGI